MSVVIVGVYLISDKEMTLGALVACNAVGDVIDPETGAVKLLQFTSAHDVGLVLNPVGHQGQVVRRQQREPRPRQIERHHLHRSRPAGTGPSTRCSG